MPHPATWLNQGRWEDDPLPPQRSKTASERNLEFVQRVLERERAEDEQQAAFAAREQLALTAGEGWER
ncbi:hypothetical protein [Agrococcus sp. SCSIO52902]|uniref:hypothetical protein n=1 Tax=Agrococcus sp. SCSIO52902 TaxID=2933290 RepID=UPI001FF5D91F|nr:hypothetical protein [Agrococcus sp. SCSIO52902]UOW00895.1 hypothetical protein MU522_00230 [Agrococcus sp. SCSIO52902]